ncbi:MAG TPA: acyltransferase family protein [Jiangellaceae bacterium]|nr:acyltransferase family protein [Jiangellaceae bacterium]
MARPGGSRTSRTRLAGGACRSSSWSARIGVPLVAWTLVYLAYPRWWLDEPLTVGEAGRDVLAGTPFLQLYFLYVLAGLYLLTPYLRILLRHTTHRIQVTFAGTLLALGLVDQVAEMLVGSGTANVATGFLPFAGYFGAGWVLRDVALHAWHVRAAALTFVASVVGTAALVGAFTVPGGWDDAGRYLYDFFAPLVVTMSVAAFVVFRSIPVGGRSPDGEGGADGSRLAVLSGVTFGTRCPRGDHLGRFTRGDTGPATHPVRPRHCRLMRHRRLRVPAGCRRPRPTATRRGSRGSHQAAVR